MPYSATFEGSTHLPRKTIYSRLADFGGLKKYFPEAIEECDLEGSGIGSVRTIRMKGKDGVIVERLEALVRAAVVDDDELVRSCPGTQRGRQVGRIREYSDVLLIALLKGKRPDTFRERYEHTAKGGARYCQILRASATNLMTNERLGRRRSSTNCDHRARLRASRARVDVSDTVRFHHD